MATLVQAFGVRVGDLVRMFGIDSNLSGDVISMDPGLQNPMAHANIDHVTAKVHLKGGGWNVIANVPLRCLTVMKRPVETQKEPKPPKVWTADVRPITAHTSQATQDARDQFIRDRDRSAGRDPKSDQANPDDYRDIVPFANYTTTYNNRPTADEMRATMRRVLGIQKGFPCALRGPRLSQVIPSRKVRIRTLGPCYAFPFFFPFPMPLPERQPSISDLHQSQLAKAQQYQAGLNGGY